MAPVFYEFYEKEEKICAAGEISTNFNPEICSAS